MFLHSYFFAIVCWTRLHLIPLCVLAVHSIRPYIFLCAFLALLASLSACLCVPHAYLSLCCSWKEILVRHLSLYSPGRQWWARLEGSVILPSLWSWECPFCFWSEIFPCLSHPVISWLYLVRGGFTAFFWLQVQTPGSYFLPVTVSTLCTARPEHFCGQLGKISWRVVMTTFVCVLCQRPEEAGQTFMCINVCECVLVKACLCACKQGLCRGLSASGVSVFQAQCIFYSNAGFSAEFLEGCCTVSP